MKCAEHCNYDEDYDEHFTIDTLENVDIFSNIIQVNEAGEIGEQLI